jgi:adenosylmethionine-8-amino-7-oxononanoate aminotransferase
MEIVRNTDLVSTISTKGERLIGRLRERLGDHPHIDFIRGRGLFIGMEVVQDKASKAPYPGNDFMFRKIRQAAFDQGLICWPGSGSAKEGGDFILLAPPYIISDAEMDELVELLAKTIDLCTL